MASKSTEERTRESIRKQKKAIYILLPAMIFVFYSLIYIAHEIMYGADYQMQYKELIEGGYIWPDHTQYEFFDFCAEINGTPLGEKFFDICLWID